MLTDFDVHPASGRLLLRCASFTGSTWLKISDCHGRGSDEVPPQLLPVHARWSPDGTRFTFATNDGSIYVRDLATRASRPVFRDPAYQAGFSEWSPDGCELAFTAYRRPEHPSSMPPPGLYLHTLATGAVRRLTEAAAAADRFPSWSPSGGKIAFQRQDLHERGTPARVHLVDVRTGAGGGLPISLLDPKAGAQRFGGFPWSRDGRWFTLRVKTNHGFAPWVVDGGGADSGWRWNGEPVAETAFSPSADRLLCVLERELVWVDWPAGSVISRLRLDFCHGIRATLSGARIAFRRSAGEVWFLGADSGLYRWDGGEVCTAVAEHTDDARPSYRLEEFTVRATDGLELPAQRLIPAAPAALGVLYVHSGPGVTLDPEDSWALQLVAGGCEVVRVAYRGSSGYGERIRRANTGCYGVADAQDVIAAGIKWQRRFGRGRPLALFGNSYGGYLSLLALADPASPFAGAVCTCPAINVISHPLHRDRALPEDPEQRSQALEQRSVFTHAPRIKRPVLIFHGALDTVATTQQLRELAQLITASGGVCELVVFDDDTHSLMRHRPEVQRKTLHFLARLKAGYSGVTEIN